MILAGWLACVSAQRVADEQDALGQAAADAIGLSLVVAEWTRHVDATTFRHANDCGCPCTEAIGTPDSYVNELDYASPPCVPQSGVLPTATTGHLWLDVDRGALDVSRVQVTVGGEPAAADLSGAVRDDAGSVDMAGVVAVGPTEADIDLAFQVDGDTLVLDGTAAVGELRLELAAVALPLDQTAVTVGCPVVDAGRIASDDGAVDLGPDWLVTWRGRERSDDPCAWVAAFLAP